MDVVRPMFNLSRFLYEGACNYDARWVWKRIEKGQLGDPKWERAELLGALKEEFETRLSSGQSIRSIQSYVSSVSLFIDYLESHQHSFSLNELETSYLMYADYLFIESHKKYKKIGKLTVYRQASTLSALFGSILDIHDGARLLRRTRIKFPPRVKKSVSKDAEKQNLEATFKLGHFLADLTAGLSVESIMGGLPVTIPVRPGLVNNDQVQLFSSRRNLAWISKPRKTWSSSQKSNYPNILRLRQPVSSINGTSRWSLVNLRIQAEFLMFIAQTGMSLEQAKALEYGALKYKPLSDSWHVQCFKKRRQGEVSFKIYKSYKAAFGRYRNFISYFFPDSDVLFPQFDSTAGVVSQSRRGISTLSGLRQVVKEYNIPWVPPRALRNTRVNWLLRRSGDPELTADMAQHTKEVLKDRYERPSQQRAMVEITRFWSKHDPIQLGELKGSLIASECDGRPEANDDKPKSVVEPNCVNPSGCLWCSHRRDLDSEDYVWSLASMRYLKTIEAGLNVTPKAVPADEVVRRISDMIAWYRNSTPERAQWVFEAEQRIAEGAYHSNWSPIIEFLES